MHSLVTDEGGGQINTGKLAEVGVKRIFSKSVMDSSLPSRIWSPRFVSRWSAIRDNQNCSLVTDSALLTLRISL